jgi:hypothetical protein
VLRANAAHARQRALNKAEIGTSAAASHSSDVSGGIDSALSAPNAATWLSWSMTNFPVSPKLPRLSSAVTILNVITVSSLPHTISRRDAGLVSKVSSVPRSFSPAHRSTAG